jgi:hypothetical protein
MPAHDKSAGSEGGASKEKPTAPRLAPADPGTLGASTQLSRYSQTLAPERDAVKDFIPTSAELLMADPGASEFPLHPEIWQAALEIADGADDPGIEPARLEAIVRGVLLVAYRRWFSA